MDAPRPATSAATSRPSRKPDADAPTDRNATRHTAGGKRWRILNAFVDFGGVDLRANDWRVWLVLFRDTKDGAARTSQSYIARRLHLDRKTVGRAIKRLQAADLLDVVHRGGFRRGMSTYRLRPTPTDLPAGQPDNAPAGRH